MTERPKITASIIAMNEEDQIADCIRSVAWCDEVLVVDSHSTDRTREIAAELGARVIERDWPGNCAQKQFATDEASHDWILNIDADERVTDELRDSILERFAQGEPQEAGFEVARLSSWLGRWIRHGWYPEWILRVFDRRRGRWEGLDPHGHIELQGSTGRLVGDLLHYPYDDVDEHLDTINRYTTTMAEGLHARGRSVGLLDLILRPPFRFLRFYVLKSGWKEGWRGFLLACFAAWYGFLKYAKVYALRRASKPS